MQHARIAIVGAGLSGLYAACLLQRQGIEDFVILEARDVLGGRIASFDAGTSSLDRFDLGPTWFWPDYQRELDQLIHELGLERFAQHEAGDMVVERTAGAAPQRMRGYANVPTSMRLLGGMGALIDALRGQLSPKRIVTGQSVRRLRRVAQGIELDSEEASGRATTWHAQHVLLALPPRLVTHGMTFLPSLPEKLATQWQETATWMAPHAKYIAVYEQPFWREQGLSGEARSMIGPLGEIHDASMPGGRAALFGFFGLPVSVRQQVPEDVLRQHCRAQFARLFGPQAATPIVDAVKDWALDPFTAVADDQHSGGQHPHTPVATVAFGPWQDVLIAIASEWSPQFPGYVAGAIEAARLGVQALPAPEAGLACSTPT
jgi:monoamine oxidase